jgi:hypothetical protein
MSCDSVCNTIVHREYLHGLQACFRPFARNSPVPLCYPNRDGVRACASFRPPFDLLHFFSCTR